MTLGVPKGIAAPLIKAKPREVMTLPLPETKEGTLSLGAYKKIKDFISVVDVLVIGPGLAQNKSTQALVRKIITNTRKPTVIDADALNALAGHLDCVKVSKYQRINELVLTPHPGEMARLAGLSIPQVQKNRSSAAREFARKYRVTVALKGQHTVVAGSNGKLYINRSGNPGMATAGSGDVLTGMIAAFLGQKLDAFSAAKYAVYLHGLAGDLAAGEKTQISLIASDIIAKIPEAIRISS